MLSEDPTYIWANCQNQSITLHQPHQENSIKSGQKQQDLLCTFSEEENMEKNKRMVFEIKKLSCQLGLELVNLPQSVNLQNETVTSSRKS